MKEFKVFDWAGNDVDSPIFNNWEDACDWIGELIDSIYGELNDDDYDIQYGEYQIIEL